MPSIRLFSLVNAWFRDPAKPCIKYVPWQFRMSQRQYTEIVEARARRVIRTEAQLISTALFDETPTIGVESPTINESWLGAIGFGVYYTRLIIRSPQDPILLIRAPSFCPAWDTSSTSTAH